MRLLVVEDNEKIAEGLSEILRGNGYIVDVVGDGASADAALASFDFDLVILDLSLPEMDGLEVLRRLRDRRKDCAVLVLTARGALDDRVKGLNLGADDYMTKPFEFSELEARVRALLRRHVGHRTARIEYGSLIFNLDDRGATLDGAKLILPKRELSVLEALILRPESVISKQQLIERLSDFDEDVSENAVEQYVSRLRRRLASAGLRIRTARGLGYILESD